MPRASPLQPASPVTPCGDRVGEDNTALPSRPRRQGRPGGNYLSVTGHRLPNSPADVQEAVTALRRVYLKYIAAFIGQPVNWTEAP